MQSTHLFSLEIARDHDAIPVSGMSQHDPLEITVSRSEVWHNVPFDFDFPLMACYIPIKLPVLYPLKHHDRAFNFSKLKIDMGLFNRKLVICLGQLAAF